MSFRPGARAAGSLRRVPPLHHPTLADIAVRHRARLVTEGCPEDAGDLVPTGVCHDSRRVVAGQVYAALPGATAHGASFAAQALRGGAVALLTDPEGRTLLGEVSRDLGCAGPPVLLHDDPRSVLGPLAAELAGDPSRDLALVGVTGTNGKTTVSFLVDEMLRGLGLSTGLVGTVRARVAEEVLPSSFTTPEAPDLQQLLSRMREAGCVAATAEVSSHALAQRRVDGTRFAVAVFTNLSQDHLDYHGTLAAYFAAKLRLLTGGFAATAVVGTDDPWGRAAAAAASEAGLQVLTVATGGDAVSGGEPAADVTVTVLRAHRDGSQDVRLSGPLGPGALRGAPVRLDVRLAMPGAFNSVNAATALTVVHALLRTGEVQVDPAPDAAALAGLLAGCTGVPGRMERVVAPGRPLVVVDYAHTPDAVRNAVAAAREATPGRLVVVLGAGGDRDRGKREAMGAAASAADLVVVTDDNPRTEDPAAIRAAVLAGVSARSVEVGDRALAVRAALRACSGPDDTVLLAGKGHETGQTGADGTLPFDDREQALAALREASTEGAAGAGTSVHGVGA